MKVLITGSEGFVGRYVTKKFLDEGYYVIGSDNLSKYGKRLNPDHDNYWVGHGDAVELIQAPYYKPDIIIDLAEDVGGANYLNKNAYNKLKSSFRLRTAMLDHCSKNPCLYVCISSSCVYDNVDRFPTQEIPLEELPAPRSPYALSKYNAEMLCRESGASYVVARLFNVAGIGDDHPTQAHVIPDLIRKIKKENILYLPNGGQQIRNFTHGSDVAEAIFRIATTSSIGSTFNVGSYNTLSILELAQKISEQLNAKIPIFGKDDNLKYNVLRSEPDIHKLWCIGYKPKWDIDMIIKEALEYYAR